jgi:hypothetical protein
MNYRSIIVAFGVVVIIVGCSTVGRTPNVNSPNSISARTPSSPVGVKTDTSSLFMSSSQQRAIGTPTFANLYVLNQNCPSAITVYEPDQTAPSRSFGPTCPDSFSAFALDLQGNLYGALYRGKHVFVYPAGSSIPDRKFSHGKIRQPISIVTDYTGQVFVSSEENGKLSVWSAGDNALIRTKPWVGPEMAVDHQNRIYVRGYNETMVLSPGGKNHLYYLADGATALALDSQDDVYVAQGYSNSIFVYKAYKRSPHRTITNGVDGPVALTIDGKGNLYCANANNVTVYAPGSSTPAYTITDGINQPDALLADGSGNLYVSNVGANSVTVYPEGSTTPSEIITDGIYHPLALAFGP